MKKVAARKRRSAECSTSRRFARALVALSFILKLAQPSFGFDPRVHQPVQYRSALDLQITQVKGMAAQNDRLKTDVEIRWTAQVPRSTTIDEFDVRLEVRYSDGSRGVA